MSEAKKGIVQELGFGGLMHIPPMNVPHKLLKDLANSFNLEKNKLGNKARTQSKKRKHIVEDSSSEQEIESYDVMKEAGLPSTEAHYDSSEIMPEVNLESKNDPMFQTQTDQSSVNKPTDSIVLIQVCMPLSQTIAASPMQIEPSPPKSLRKKISEETIKGLGFTDLSQEETLTQEGRPGSEKGKSPETPILIEELEDLVEQITNTGVAATLNFAEDKIPPIEKQPADQFFEKFETPARRTKLSADLKEK
ncbi:hypothetical protein Ahy_B10g104927 [Arachis hypogaea]|uniref:Uncharacterized protein n=1 Tax=Arachis hypogaea TaxID=3818 RepID=A0A444X6Q3_ARAHY|nr:hypothetical protein Ahy_B10g104927 [Arachis hypogaea]